MLSVDLRGPYLVSRATLRDDDRPRPGGAIVHIASVAGVVGGRGSAAYVAAKGGLIALTRAMALDHAEQGIRVNCVCPGMVRTPMLIGTEVGLDGDALERVRGERAARHPLGRVGVPADVVPGSAVPRE